MIGSALCKRGDIRRLVFLCLWSYFAAPHATGQWDIDGELDPSMSRRSSQYPYSFSTSQGCNRIVLDKAWDPRGLGPCMKEERRMKKREWRRRKELKEQEWACTFLNSSSKERIWINCAIGHWFPKWLLTLDEWLIPEWPLKAAIAKLLLLLLLLLLPSCCCRPATQPQHNMEQNVASH